MAVYVDRDRFEFDLTIKHFGIKPQPEQYREPWHKEDDKRKEELLEKLTFNARTAVEVIRKLLDYLR